MIAKLDALISRSKQKTELAGFLIQVDSWSLLDYIILIKVAAEFEFGIKENWDQINVITMEDRLEALE